jgi:hypothetical protein
MKQLLLLTTTLFVLISCKTSKDYLSKADEDRTLFDVVKRLNKRNNDADATAALPEVYKKVQQKHLRKISALQNSTELNRWEKLLDEYTTMQHMYDAIINSNTASTLVNATSYAAEIFDTKQKAAEEYYALANTLLQSTYRDEIKKAYGYFKKADKWVSGFKDARTKMDQAYEAATIDVVVNPVQDNSFFFNTGWGNTGYNYSNEYFQQNLIRDLGGNSGTRYPARFYTEWEARRQNVKPHWVVDLTLRHLDIPQPIINTFNRTVSKQIENGRDTSGRIIYQTVTATMHITKTSFTAQGQMDVSITDIHTRKNIANNSYRDDYRWEEETATYSGNSQALSQNDWALVNNSRNNQQPNKEQVLNELYRKIYPQVKNRVAYSVDW